MDASLTRRGGVRNGFVIESARNRHLPETPLTDSDLQLWSARLLAAAFRTLPADFAAGGEAALREFSDEQGNRRAGDEPLLAWVLGVPPRPAGGPESPDVGIWRTLAEKTRWDDWLLAPNRAIPLLELPPETPLEVWTEAELSALHGLWHIARRDERSDLEQRCMAAAAAYMEQTQPDNATNHPWAIHVFLVHAHRTGSDDGRMYAEAMLHNCMVGSGKPDRLSAVILLDAAHAVV